ncbi:MAG: hypothetical protein GY862_00795, partial [Gammaproteobacteria bacterium]|nr:hypothetical protein [Gammaproteobacteria bacterium]
NFGGRTLSEARAFHTDHTNAPGPPPSCDPVSRKCPDTQPPFNIGARNFAVSTSEWGWLNVRLRQEGYWFEVEPYMPGFGSNDLAYYKDGIVSIPNIQTDSGAFWVNLQLDAGSSPLQLILTDLEKH